MGKITKQNTFKKYNYKSAAINREVHEMASEYCREQGMWLSRYIKRLIIDDLLIRRSRGEFKGTGVKRSPIGVDQGGVLQDGI